MRKSYRQQYKNNKLKIIASTWNDELLLPESFYSVSNNQDYIKYIIKTYQTVTDNPQIYIYINRINKTLLFKIKDIDKHLKP